MESTVEKPKETVRKLNDIRNMSWLKHNSQSPEKIKHTMERKVIVPDTPVMQDFVAGSNPVKRRKSKKSKNKGRVSNANTFKDTKADFSSADTIKDIKTNVLGADISKIKPLDTDIQNSRKQAKETPELIASSAITVTSSTVWNANTSAATALFPEAHSASVQIVDEDIELEKVLKDSILTAQIEQFRLNDEIKVNWADELEDLGWDSGHHRLETSYDKDKNTEKVEKKSRDDNNNSDNKFVNFKEDPQKIDNYGRARGDVDKQHLTERDAHTKEQQIFGHENNTDCFNQRQSTSVPEKSVCDHSRKINPYDNRNRGQRDYVDNRSNDDRREYRNRNFQTFNQRSRFDNHQHRYDNQNHSHRYDNHPQRHDNQRHNQQQKNEVQQQYNNQPYRYDNLCQRHEDQERRFENNRYGNNQRRGFLNRGQHQYSNSHKEELRNRDSYEFKNSKEDSDYESNKNNTPEIQQPSEKEKEEEPERKPDVKPDKEDINEISHLNISDVKPDKEEINEISHLNISTTEDSPSFTFMQESINEEESCENAVENNGPKSETAFEKSEYPDTHTEASNPYIVTQVPIQTIHPSGIMYQTPESVPIHNGIFAPQNVSTFNKQPGAITYNMVTNPYIGSVLNPQHFQPQHTHEIIPESGCTVVPMHNYDIRLYHQSPFVHNHPIMPITLPMAMSPCGQLQQMPLGSLPGMNFVHQHPVNCQQCSPNFCQSQRIPIQNLNCQSPIYPQFTNIMTPMGSVLMPITPVNQEQIIPQPGQTPHYVNISQPDKMVVTPATVIEKSANNLVNLCENLPSRSGRYPMNCPPGFKNNASLETPCASQKKIICDKERDILPSFKNIPKEYTEEKSRIISKKTEEFSDERLDGILNTIFDTTKSENLEKEEVNLSFKWSESSTKFSMDSYQEQLLKSSLNSEQNLMKSKDIQAPKPGIRFGLGRGKKISRAD